MDEEFLSWYSSFLCSVMEDYAPEIVDNCFNEVIGLNFIRKNSKVDAIKDGPGLIIPLTLGKHSGGKAYSMYDKFDLKPQGGIGQAKTKLAKYAIPVLFADDEIDQNDESKIFDITKAKFGTAKKSLIELLVEDFYLKGTAKSLTGLAAMLEDNPGEYMGVTDTKWKNHYFEGASDNLASLFSKAYRAAKDGSKKPDLILTSDEGEELYENLLTNNGASGVDVGIRYASNDTGDIAYGALTYKKAPILADKAAPNNGSFPIYHFLNTENLGFTMEDPKQTALAPVGGMLAASGFVKTKAQLYTDNRRRHAKLKLTS